MDYTGVEISYYVGEIFYNYTKEARFAPPGLLRNMVKAGYLGRKTGKGFYEYPAKPPQEGGAPLP
jgi:3-hydroxybutyryl-CoA dehydrogenase